VPKIKVRVNDKIARYGGAFTDPASGVMIGTEPVEVELTQYVMRWLSTGQIVEVEEKAVEKRKSAKWPKDLRADIVETLVKFGYTPEEVKAADDDELLALEGIGPAKLKQIREAFASSDEE